MSAPKPPSLCTWLAAAPLLPVLAIAFAVLWLITTPINACAVLWNHFNLSDRP